MKNQEPNQNGREEKITPSDLTLSVKSGDGSKDASPAIREKSPLRLKIENFFYYYKWHTLAGLFIVFAIVICSVQMCRKTSTDNYILYAGAHDVGKVGQNGDVSEYETCLSVLRQYTDDVDGDGNRTVGMETLYLLSPDEKKALQEQLISEGNRYTLNETQLSENATSLTDHLLAGDAYLCILSSYWLETYEGYFAPIGAYAESEGAVLNEAGNGVYLNSTSLGKKPGFENFPEDTVICLRKLSAVGGKRAEKAYHNAEDMLRNLLK